VGRQPTGTVQREEPNRTVADEAPAERYDAAVIRPLVGDDAVLLLLRMRRFGDGQIEGIDRHLARRRGHLGGVGAV